MGNKDNRPEDAAGLQGNAGAAGLMSRAKLESALADMTDSLRANMEKRVEERTRELSERTTALESFNQTMMGRESRVIELKEEVNRLRAAQGKEPTDIPAADACEVSAAELLSSAISPNGTSDAAMPVFWISRLRWIAAFVLLASLSVTGVTWFIVHDKTMRLAQERFDFRVDTVNTALQSRLMSYQSMLRGAAALFAASGEVTRREWKSYVEAIRIKQEYPGIQGVGFSRRIPPAEREAHLRLIRSEGFPRYAIRPDGERTEYTSIIYLEPFDSLNQRAFGYDMFSEPVRREAMTRARDTGLPALSGKVTPAQETDKNVQAGFLMYLPVYRHGTELSTTDQRRESLEGYAYSPFRMNDFIRGITAKDPFGIEFEIYDGEQPLKENLMYSSSGRGGLAEHRHPYLFRSRTAIEFGGRRWLLSFTSSQQFENSIEQGKANIIIWLGTLLSLLISGMILFFDRSYRQTIALAGMAKEFERTNLILSAEAAKRKQSEIELQRRLDEISAINENMIGRENRLIELKEEVNRLCDELGRAPSYPPLWRADVNETEYRAPAVSGEEPS
jgi:CHASE1-domain containing sensor protein